jgi:hypothetical protein
MLHVNRCVSAKIAPLIGATVYTSRVERKARAGRTTRLSRFGPVPRYERRDARDVNAASRVPSIVSRLQL